MIEDVILADEEAKCAKKRAKHSQQVGYHDSVSLKFNAAVPKQSPNQMYYF